MKCLLSLLLPLIMLSSSVRSFTTKTIGVTGRSGRAACITRSASFLSSPASLSHQQQQRMRAVAPSYYSAVVSTSTTSSTTRWMSSGEGDGPSVVEQCRQKIAVALDTEDVTVTGELHFGLYVRPCFYLAMRVFIAMQLFTRERFTALLMNYHVCRLLSIIMV